jgi:hypothetical protein
MGYFVFFFTVFLLALAGKGFFGFSIILPFMMATAYSFDPSFGLALGFCSGLLLSVLYGTLMGRESIGFLAVMGMFYFSSSRLGGKQIWYLLLFSIIGSTTYALLAGYELSLNRIVREVVFFFLFLPLVARLKSKYFSQEISLKL